MKRIRMLSKVNVVEAYHVHQGPFLDGLEKVLRSQLDSLTDKSKPQS